MNSLALILPVFVMLVDLVLIVRTVAFMGDALDEISEHPNLNWRTKCMRYLLTFFVAIWLVLLIAGLLWLWGISFGW